MEEHQLISCLKYKDKSCLEYLYDNYAPPLYGTILAILKVEKLAEEVLQDTFLKIWDNIDYYDPGKGKLFTWMRRLAHNLAIDRVRSREFQNMMKTDSDEYFVYEEKGELVTETYQDHIGLNKVIETLPEECRVVLDYSYFKGYTMTEIAKEFNLPTGTVKTRLRKAMKLLRTEIGIH